ncbi:Tetracycline resistance multidrug resistance protein [Rutstroemia sp. NJR-2017a BBW]|nr:Tetracycline resistance multidrug resistance protein [Rutstroemia sp. NJR-2017a BBW]
MAGSGFAQAFWMIVVFPPLHKRIGSYGSVRSSGRFSLHSVRSRTSFSVKVMKQLFGFSTQVLPCGQLVINDISPSSDTLGTLNAISLATVAAARTVIPALFTSIFAYGSTHQILWGYLVWVFEILVALGLIIAIQFLPEEAYGKRKSNEE